MIISGIDCKASFGLLVAAAVALFEVISKALPGFFNTLVAFFYQPWQIILPILPSPSAFTVLSLTVINVNLLQIEQ